MASFNSAFAAARKSGKKEFTWNGKKFHTRLKGEGNKKSGPSKTTKKVPTPTPRPERTANVPRPTPRPSREASVGSDKKPSQMSRTEHLERGKAMHGKKSSTQTAKSPPTPRPSRESASSSNKKPSQLSRTVRDVVRNALSIGSSRAKGTPKAKSLHEAKPGETIISRDGKKHTVK